MAEGPELIDILLPAAPGFWPPAPGWWVLALLLTAVLILLGLLLRRRLRMRAELAWLRAALDALGERFPEPQQAAERTAALAVLLRRMVLRHHPDSAALSGEPWLEFLDGDDPARPFSRGDGRLLLDAPYRRSVDPAQAVTLETLVRASLPRWLERSRV